MLICIATFYSSCPSRCLRDGELFEIIIQKMVDRWSGSIEAGELNLSGPAAVAITTLVLNLNVFLLQA